MAESDLLNTKYKISRYYIGKKKENAFNKKISLSFLCYNNVVKMFVILNTGNNENINIKLVLLNITVEEVVLLKMYLIINLY